jgi:hypothetical protein
MGKPNSQEANNGTIFRETDRTNDQKYGGKYGMKKLLRV